jgi:hypothetical protein
VSKLDRIHLDAFYDGLPLSEVVRSLSEQAKIRDPDKKGINFLINPNPDNSVSTLSPVGAGGFGGGGFPGGAVPGAPTVDPATGLPVAPAGGGGAEAVDLNAVVIKIWKPFARWRIIPSNTAWLIMRWFFPPKARRPRLFTAGISESIRTHLNKDCRL